MTRPVQVIGVPADFGANRRGVDMGPSAIRYAGLGDELAAAGVNPTDAGDLLVPRMEEPDAAEGAGEARFLEEVEGISRRLADEVAATIGDGQFPLILGGDHSIAIGTLSGSAREAEVGALWLDAHADFNTPSTSPSGNVHGMPLAAALGCGEFGDMPWAQADGLAPENVAWVGLRNLDDSERETIRESPASAYTMADIDERGVGPVVKSALEDVTQHAESIHVSLDLDLVDPDEAPGVGTPVRGGVTYREAHTIMEVIADADERSNILRSMDVVEVNPILDTENRTAALAAELAASVLGKRIL